MSCIERCSHFRGKFISRRLNNYVGHINEVRVINNVEVSHFQGFYHACSTLTNQVARFEVSKSLIHLVIGV